MTHQQLPMIAQPKIILITGNMAAGKSSVAQAVAERLPHSVHLRGDIFRRMIVNGQADMTFNLSAEAYQQLHLRYQIAANVARLYLQAGFTVVYQDIIIGPDLADVVASYHDLPLYLVVLCPAADVIAARDMARSKIGYTDNSMVLEFDRVLRTETPRLGYWLDNTQLTIAATADQILANLSQAALPTSAR